MMRTCSLSLAYTKSFHQAKAQMFVGVERERERERESNYGLQTNKSFSPIYFFSGTYPQNKPP